MTLKSLVKKSEFHKVYEDGVKYVGRLLVVYLLLADDQRRSVVASKRVGNAVCRNRAKRVLREAMRNGCLGQPDKVIEICERVFPDSDGTVPGQGGKTGLWVVIVARHRILQAKSQDVQRELDDLLS